ncbi:hypothetical protein GOHSU_46_00160 [Gordonia hirsuta DSM 44140 = NBRC 16056]|uniref:Uncharacterized protein n=1 Tax=Gordonia hirsuta DSM 44140 = NBRC 16056 TaxID=1121927 RepID=L7LC37_9ACTN|nr:DUF6325 family protein [Gordonia hirsuta]GAC58695.1 hypothetical protein GOHSU_46_00160 [Gordonia hirsuta DSM 44140 = NBRC 16056]
MIFSADLGPVNHIVIGFSGDTVPESGFEQLRVLDIEDRIKLLDIEFIAKSADGEVSWVTAESVGMEKFVASANRLIGEGDLAAIGGAMDPGTVAAVVVWEDLTLRNAVRTWKAGGATVLSRGPVSPDHLAAVDDQ